MSPSRRAAPASDMGKDPIGPVRPGSSENFASSPGPNALGEFGVSIGSLCVRYSYLTTLTGSGSTLRMGAASFRGGLGFTP
jgi:hypothetical protein